VPRGFIIPERTVELIGHFLAQNGRTYHPVMMKMTAAELREAKSREWADRKRAWLLAKIEKRIKALELAAELAVIVKNARKTAGRRGRLPLTIRQIEREIEEKFRGPDTLAARQRVYELRRLLKKRREEATRKAIELAQSRPSGVLLKKQLATYKKAVGDHDHAGLEVGSICPLCAEVISRGMSCLLE
jgi:hypothetical protein